MKKQHLFKAVICLMALCTAFSLCGCGDNTSGSSDENSSVENKDPEYSLTTIIASGECGKENGSITWELDDNGLLVISGSGIMCDKTEWDNKKSKIKKIIIKNGVTNIGDYAFDDCYNVVDVTIPDSVTLIGTCAFADCESLKEMTIPDSVTLVKEDTFCECTSLSKVKLSDNLEGIQSYLFYKCTNLEELKLPDSCTYIGMNAFSGCTNLKSINIPDSMNFIGEEAFSDCTSISYISLPGSIEKIGSSVFSGWTSSQTIKFNDIYRPSINWDSDWNKDCNAEIKGEEI